MRFTHFSPAQHLAEDPLPLRRAKITTEAATKKAQKAREDVEAKVREAEAYLEVMLSFYLLFISYSHRAGGEDKTGLGGRSPLVARQRVTREKSLLAHREGRIQEGKVITSFLCYHIQEAAT